MSEAGTTSQSNSFEMLCEDEVLNSRRGFARGPERALMAALLFDGIQTYINLADCEGRVLKSRWREAAYWVHSDGGDYVFAFDNVCEALGIDADFLRCGLINVVQSQGYEWRRTRRVA